MEKSADCLQLLQSALGEISTLKFRATSLEQRVMHLEEAKLELKQKVARLERFQVERQSIDLKEPGNPIGKSKRS